MLDDVDPICIGCAAKEFNEDDEIKPISDEQFEEVLKGDKHIARLVEVLGKDRVKSILQEMVQKFYGDFLKLKTKGK